MYFLVKLLEREETRSVSYRGKRLKMRLAITKICQAMREYQKLNNIVGCCMTNVQTLYDIVKSTYPDTDIQAKAVICINAIEADDSEFDQMCCLTSTPDDTKTPIMKQTIHLMLKVDGVYYEPSYELYKDSPMYFTSIKNLLEGVEPNTLIKDNLKETLPAFLNFVKLAERINAGELLITNYPYGKDYYDNQILYLIEHKYVLTRS